MEYLDTLFPETGGREMLDNWWLKKYTLQHGDLSRLPRCLQPPDGSAVGLHCLENWHKDDPFDVAVVDEVDYTQITLRDSSPMALYRLGAPVKLTNMHHRNSELNAWVSGVCKELGACSSHLTVNGWFARKSHGLGWHYDPGEVILIQLVGVKRMRIVENKLTTLPDTQYELAKPCSATELPLFVDGFPGKEPDLSGVEDIELRPGSVLAMPRGMWHDSLAMDADSIAIALFFRTPTVADLTLSYLREKLRQDSLWRMPVYGDDKSARELVASRLGSLEEYCRSIHSEQVIAQTIPMAGRTRLLEEAPFTLQRLPEARFSIKEKNRGTIELIVLSRLNMRETKVSRMSLEKRMTGALKWIERTGARFTIADIAEACPDLPIGHLEGLAETLLETNYLVILPFPSVTEGSASP